MSLTDLDPRPALRAWVAAKAGDIGADERLDGIQLFRDRVLTSLHFPELILLIERLARSPVDVTTLEADDVASIDAIVNRFFSTEARQ